MNTAPEIPPRRLKRASKVLLAGALGLLLAACAGAPSGGEEGGGKSMVVLPLDTAAIRTEGASGDDVIAGFPDDGGPLSPRRILAAQFQDRFRRSLDHRLAKVRLRVMSAADTPAVAPAYALRIDSLRTYRDTTTNLMPKIGVITQYPLYLRGHWTLLAVAPADSAVATGQFRSFVTHKLEVQPNNWRDALDAASRQVAKDMPFGY